MDIYALCRQYGPLLKMPPGSGIDGKRFMLAIAGCESSFGKNVTPRHEPAFDFGGTYATKPPQDELLKEYGGKAAYSYGPWQILPCNALGYTPDELQGDEEKCAQAFVGFFNHYIIGQKHALTLNEMAQAYNSGHYSKTPDVGVQRYAADVLHYYQSAVFPA